jgi:hypothetical protein
LIIKIIYLLEIFDHRMIFTSRGGGLALALVLINTNSTGAMSRENKRKKKYSNKKDAQGASA